MPASAKLSGLATVQSLYLLQVQLVESLREGLRTPNQVKQAKENLRRFSSLLASADWQYMGGEDVYESLQGVRKDISQRISRRAATKSAHPVKAHKAAKQTTRAAAPAKKMKKPAMKKATKTKTAAKQSRKTKGRKR